MSYEGQSERSNFVENVVFWLSFIVFNPSYVTGLTKLYPLKTLENQIFSDVFRG